MIQRQFKVGDLVSVRLPTLPQVGNSTPREPACGEILSIDRGICLIEVLNPVGWLYADIVDLFEPPPAISLIRDYTKLPPARNAIQ